MGPNLSDPIVVLKPKNQWKTAGSREELVDKMRHELEKIPGIGLNLTQPIALRVDELVSGVKSQLAVKLFGEDMAILKEQAEEIAKTMGKVKGVADLRVEQVSGQPYLTVTIDRNAIARYGINAQDINEIVETAIGGKAATEVLEGDRRFEAVLRFPEGRRNSVETIGNILVRTPTGAGVPLAQLANIAIASGPVQISRENSKRRIVIECNIEDRDVAGFVKEAKERIEKGGQAPGRLLYYMGRDIREPAEGHEEAHADRARHPGDHPLSPLHHLRVFQICLSYSCDHSLCPYRRNPRPARFRAVPERARIRGLHRTLRGWQYSTAWSSSLTSTV